VRIVRDAWGVPHIHAENTHDLFFAQGFVQAQDRLFQMDLWRRSVRGDLSGVLGANFVERDVMTRRMEPVSLRDDEGAADWAVLGEETHAIARAFVQGINAWVGRVLATPPEEFRLAGWTPAFWRPEDLLWRADAFAASANAQSEILRAGLVGAVGPARTAVLMPLEPSTPLVVPRGLDPSLVTLDVGDVLHRVGTAPFFAGFAAPFDPPAASNAWAIGANRSTTGAPLVAADPHEPFDNPARHYLIHLQAPGWNVIGATEPWAPGVAIGHNDRVAWGATAFAADVEDLFVERTDPAHPGEVRDGAGWAPVRRVGRPMQVKGQIEPLEYFQDTTRHGVVVAVDSEHNLAFALRWAGLEPGAAPALAALSIDRAVSADAFRAALAAWKTPARVFVFADTEGNVGLQGAGLVPIRRGWSGALPVPGWTGGYDWTGWRSLDELPHAMAGRDGYVASANEQPASLAARASIGVDWDAAARRHRLDELLSGDATLSLDAMARIQRDVTAWNAARLVPLLAPLHSDDAEVEPARQALLAWDRRVAADSTAASIYVAWEDALARALIAPHVERRLAGAWAALVGQQRNVLVDALTHPSTAWFGDRPAAARDRLLLDALARALERLSETGPDAARGGIPAWGDLHAVLFSHPLALTDASRARYDRGPFPLAGYRHTVAASGGPGFSATWGAPFRTVMDLSHWNAARVWNAPGQSEWPASTHFDDLVDLGGAGIPLLFRMMPSRETP
jgi:penicillin amidase